MPSTTTSNEFNLTSISTELRILFGEMASIIAGLSKQFASKLFSINSIALSKQLHTSAILCKSTRFLDHNKKIYPPQGPDEEPRPAVRIQSFDHFVNYIIQFIFIINLFFYVVCMPSN